MHFVICFFFFLPLKQISSHIWTFVQPSLLVKAQDLSRLSEKAAGGPVTFHCPDLECEKPVLPARLTDRQTDRQLDTERG